VTDEKYIVSLLKSRIFHLGRVESGIETGAIGNPVDGARW